MVVNARNASAATSTTSARSLLIGDLLWMGWKAQLFVPSTTGANAGGLQRSVAVPGSDSLPGERRFPAHLGARDQVPHAHPHLVAPGDERRGRHANELPARPAGEGLVARHPAVDGGRPLGLPEEAPRLLRGQAPHF